MNELINQPSMTDTLSTGMGKEKTMTTIKITGMRCGHCVASVTQALSSLAGISDVQVNLDKNEATFTETTPVDPSVIKEAIAQIGFEVAA